MAELPACWMHNPVIPSLSLATCCIFFQLLENSHMVIPCQLQILILHFSIWIICFNYHLGGDECLQTTEAG